MISGFVSKVSNGIKDVIGWLRKIAFAKSLYDKSFAESKKSASIVGIFFGE
jgi:hypothetical protein